MSQRARALRAVVFLTLYTGCRVAAAAADLDLERITPVPGDQPIPVMDFFRPNLLQQPSLSPDGTHIAAIVSEGADQHNLLVHDIATKRSDTIAPPTDRDINSFRWLTDRRILFQLSARKLYGVGLFAVDINDIRGSYPVLLHFGSRIVSVPDAARDQPLIWNRYDGLDSSANRDLGVASVATASRDEQYVDLFGSSSAAAIDSIKASNDRHLLKRYPAPPTGIVTSYRADKAGELAFCEAMVDGYATLYRLEAGQWVKCPVNVDDLDIIGPGERPNELVVIGPRQEGKPRALQFIDAATGQLGDVILQDDAYDFYTTGSSPGWLHREPKTHQIIGAVFDRNGPAEVWFNDSYRSFQKIIDAQFPEQIVQIIDSDDAQKVFLVASFSDRQPVLYSWVNIEKRTAGLLQNSAPWIDPKRMQPINVLRFKTRDGHKLDAYLTLPKGASKEHPAPLVVLPHGGPWVRDAWRFNREAQFLASRGYAVLKPNYRGSLGYNWAFPDEDRYDFVKMHNDVTDATRSIIKSGLVDPHRIAIMGASFGGYLALAGVVDEPELYRCAVTIAGVFDWEELIQEEKSEQYDSPNFGFFIRRLGDPKKNPALFEAISPGRRVDRIRVPVFVAGGKEDRVVEITQSRRLLSSLRKYNVPNESYIVAGEGHGMGYFKHEVDLYTRIEAFLAKNLAPTP